MPVPRDTIVYYPYSNDMNLYVSNMVSVFKQLGEVISLQYVLRHPFIMFRVRAIILNWIENGNLFQLICVLLWFRIWGSQVCWTFHNKVPHESHGGLTELKYVLLEMFSTSIIVHSTSSISELRTESGKKKAYYVPLIHYIDTYPVSSTNLRIDNNIPDDAFVYLFIGMIRPYKNIEILISAMKKLKLENTYLVIAGKPISQDYEDKIISLTKDVPNVRLDLRAIPDNMMNNYLQMCDVLVLPYNLRSSMNSGTMIMAFSNKKTVIVPPISMAKDINGMGFIYMYDYDVSSVGDHEMRLMRIMLDVFQMGKEKSKLLGERSFEYVQEHNNPDIVLESVRHIIFRDILPKNS